MAGEPGGEDAALSGYVPESWPPELRTALDDWYFGALVPTVPLMWAQYLGLDSVLQVEVDNETPGQQADESGGTVTEVPAAAVPVEEVPADQDASVDHLGRSGWSPNQAASEMVAVSEEWPSVDEGHVVCGVVLSQTCDVVATGPGKRHPTVQVAAVVRVENLNADKRAAMECWEVADRALLEPPGWDGTYVADLRLSVPVSKAVLARHIPIPAYGDATKMLLLADHVATKVRRPALHDFLSETVRDEIRQAIKQTKRDAGWWAPVEEILVLTWPTRLNPDTAQLLVVAQQSLEAADKQRWHDLSEQLVARGKKVGITLRPPLHTTAATLTADVYRGAVKLHLPELRTPPY